MPAASVKLSGDDRIHHPGFVDLYRYIVSDECGIDAFVENMWSVVRGRRVKIQAFSFIPDRCEDDILRRNPRQESHGRRRGGSDQEHR